MKMIFNLLGLGSLYLTLASCALVPESINLHPVLMASTTNIGKGNRVAVQVIDARKQQKLGGRANYWGGAFGADITLSKDPASTVKEAVFDGLKNYGFEPVDISTNPSNSRLLRISISNLEYREILHIFNIDVVVNSSMDVSASNNTEIYTNTYRKQKIHTVVIAPPKSQDQKYLNEVYSDTLRQLLTDKQLLNFLAK